jgi:hypothetical protein
VREVHAGLSTVMECVASAERFEAEIRKLATALQQQQLTP